MHFKIYNYLPLEWHKKRNPLEETFSVLTNLKVCHIKNIENIY